jgi:hypothetical protein
MVTAMGGQVPCGRSSMPGGGPRTHVGPQLNSKRCHVGTIGFLVGGTRMVGYGLDFPSASGRGSRREQQSYASSILDIAVCVSRHTPGCCSKQEASYEYSRPRCKGTWCETAVWVPCE